MARPRSARRRLAYRQGWGGEFEREPLEVFQQREADRAVSLVEDRLPEIPIPGSRARPGRITPAVPTSPPPIPGVQQPEVFPEDTPPGLGHMAGRTTDSISRGPISGALNAAWNRVSPALDAASETGIDLSPVTNSPVYNAGQGIRMAGEAVGGRVGGFLQGAGQAIAPTDARPLDPVQNLRNPRQFVERQAEEFQQRPTSQQLVAGTLNDPTNIVGAGAATTGLRGLARVGQVRRIPLASRGLNAAARANEIADVAQTRYAREALGAAAGGTAAAMQGGDAQDIALGAGIGALGGRASRGLPGRLGTGMRTPVGPWHRGRGRRGSVTPGAAWLRPRAQRRRRAGMGAGSRVATDQPQAGDPPRGRADGQRTTGTVPGGGDRAAGIGAPASERSGSPAQASPGARDARRRRLQPPGSAYATGGHAPESRAVPGRSGG